MGSAMRAVDDQSRIERRHLRRLAGLHGAARAEYCMRGADDADDEAIFADIVRSLSRARNDARKALATLREIGVGDFAGLDETKAEAAAMTLLRREDPVTTALGRAVLQCYYRDNRVMRAMGLKPRAALRAGPRGGTGRLVLAGRGARPTKNMSRR
jgi:hypothetical protein